jgi:hypothetical protein
MMNADLTIYKPTTMVERRRQMAQMPAIMNTFEPIERSVFLASTDKIIAGYVDSELLAELNKDLRFICKDVGYRNADPKEYEYLTFRVCEILKRYYSTMTMREFRLAFEMCITGELDDYLPKGRDGQADRGHYQQFNAEYVCKVLNAYKQRRAQVLKKANDALPPQEQARNVVAEKKNSDEIRRDCITAFNFFRDNGYMPRMSPIAEMLYYNLIAECGFAPEIEVTEDEQNEILKRTIHQFIGKGYIGDAEALRQAGPKAPEIQNDAYVLSRRKALKQAFKKMVADGVEITDYITVE